MIDGQTLERFWSKVEADDETGCLLWTAAKVHNGYGRFLLGGKVVYAHRVAWEQLRGPIPDGLQIDHLCRVRNCVNPAHMEIVDNRTNVLRGIGPTAINATKTECPHGHPYDEANTYIRANGGRACRACHRLRDRAWDRRLDLGENTQ